MHLVGEDSAETEDELVDRGLKAIGSSRELPCHHDSVRTLVLS